MYPGSEPRRTRVPAIIVARPNSTATIAKTLWVIFIYLNTYSAYISWVTWTPNDQTARRKRSGVCDRTSALLCFFDVLNTPSLTSSFVLQFSYTILKTLQLLVTLCYQSRYPYRCLLELYEYLLRLHQAAMLKTSKLP